MTDKVTNEEFDLKQYKRSPNFTAIFTNNVNFAFSPIDVQMICSRTVASMDKDVEAVEEVTTIIMTPQHAKAVLYALQGNLQAYEEKHGEIKMPNDAQLPQLETKEQQVLASAARRKKK
jgi:hypothetical protein